MLNIFEIISVFISSFYILQYNNNYLHLNILYSPILNFKFYIIFITIWPKMLFSTFLLALFDIKINFLLLYFYFSLYLLDNYIFVKYSGLLF